MNRTNPDIVVGKVISKNSATCQGLFVKRDNCLELEVIDTSVGKSLEYFEWKTVKVSGRVKPGRSGKHFLWVDKILTINPMDSYESPMQLQQA